MNTSHRYSGAPLWFDKEPWFHCDNKCLRAQACLGGHCKAVSEPESETLDTLIHDLKALTESSRDLDMRIDEYLYPEYSRKPWRNQDRGWTRPEDGLRTASTPYTSLTDTAMDLARRGVYVCVASDGAAFTFTNRDEYGDWFGQGDECLGATPAIAVCIAALTERKDVSR